MLRHINPLAAEPLQTEAQVRTPAASHENADTSITPQGGKKKKTCWTWWGGAWGNIYSFILFIQQNKQGSVLCRCSDNAVVIYS